ncbi:MAG: sensor domain-containing diguanylate cyclase [Treponema sp.]|nr:sensor domain-containing diguanylate cyclase [Treponema sp.]
MKHVIVTSVIIAIVAVLIAINIPTLIKASQPDVEKNKLTAMHINDTLNAALDHPITVAKAMAANTMLLKALREETAVSRETTEQTLNTYLSSIQKNFGYTAAFVVSDKTHRYYTPQGISKIVNSKDDPYDIWYQMFLTSGRPIDLDTDRDQVNSWRWTIFVNVRITDTDGSLLGVCGVGLFMDELQDIILKTERYFNLKINIIDEDGLVQIDSDGTNIKNAYISEAIADNATEGKFVYTPKSYGRYRITFLMANLEWYVVVQHFADTGYRISIIFVLTALYLLLAVLVILIIKKAKSAKLKPYEKDQNTKDTLTGLPNRNYLKAAFGELGVFNTTRYKSLIMFDIDRFKVINDIRNGDAILLGIVELATEAIGEQGLMFRWSGDEFVAFLEMTAEEAEVIFTGFCKTVKDQLDVTVSAGITPINLAESIKTNYHRAVQLCYAVKEAGGNGVRRKL